jgi:hypothetical protein
MSVSSSGSLDSVKTDLSGDTSGRHDPDQSGRQSGIQQSADLPGSPHAFLAIEPIVVRIATRDHELPALVIAQHPLGDTRPLGRFTYSHRRSAFLVWLTL